MIKVKHAVERACDRVKGTPTDTLSSEESVFNEAQNRSLIGQAVVDVIAPRVRGNNQQREAGTVATSALGMVDNRSGKGSRAVSALTGRSEAIRLGGGLVGNGPHLM